MRLAYADPPYPGKANRYPECQEVDHAALIAQLCEYDGWALSTDEVNLRDVIALCPPSVRVLAWCRSNAPPFLPFPYASWEPVLLTQARADVECVPSYFAGGAAIGPHQREGLTGQKTTGKNVGLMAGAAAPLHVSPKGIAGADCERTTPDARGHSGDGRTHGDNGALQALPG